jgi:hypothetical protein
MLTVLVIVTLKTTKKTGFYIKITQEIYSIKKMVKKYISIQNKLKNLTALNRIKNYNTMKISKIIETKNLTSATINVLNFDTVLCEIFTSDRRVKKLYKKLDVDIDIPKISNSSVKHLGIKKYFHLVTDDYYINLYYY